MPDPVYDGPPDPPPHGSERRPARNVSASDEPAEADAEARFLRFVEHVKKKRPSLSATLVQVRPLGFTDQVLRLGCDTDFDAQKLNRRDTQDALSRLLAGHEGHEIRIEVVRLAGEEGPKTINEKEDSAEAARRADLEKRAREHPSVDKLRGLFGAEIAKVRVVDDGESR